LVRQARADFKVLPVQQGRQGLQAKKVSRGLWAREAPQVRLVRLVRLVLCTLSAGMCSPTATVSRY
jgi:hypothetical protein